MRILIGSGGKFICANCGAILPVRYTDDGRPYLMHPMEAYKSCPAAGKQFNLPTIELAEIVPEPKPQPVAKKAGK